MTTTPNPVSIEATATTPVSVELCNGLPTTTSLDVAKHFGKRHDNVIKDIQSLEYPAEFRVLNFEETLREIPGPQGAVAF